jgi:hypothetical protein
MRSFAILLLTLWLVPSAALARLEAGFGLSLAWPQSEFKDNVDFAFGGGARIGWGLRSESAAVVTIFGDLNYLNYGRERRVEPFSLTIPDVVVNVITDNYMFMLSPGVSFGVRNGTIRPYGEFFGGLTYIATKTRIENRDLPSEPIAESTNFSDFTYNLGFGGGLKLLVWQKKIDMALTELREALIDIKFTYIKGGEAEYLKKGSISRDLGSISYETIQSNTDLLQLRIGMSFGF